VLKTKKQREKMRKTGVGLGIWKWDGLELLRGIVQTIFSLPNGLFLKEKLSKLSFKEGASDAIMFLRFQPLCSAITRNKPASIK
jgi:hypothetical protein